MMRASQQELAQCPGLGERKVQRLRETFAAPFVARRAPATAAPAAAAAAAAAAGPAAAAPAAAPEPADTDGG